MESKTDTILQVNITGWTMDERMSLHALIDKVDQGMEAVLVPSTPHVAIEEPDDEPTSGWTLDAYHEAMRGLLGKYFAQAQAINEAIKTGSGFVSRDRVYELADYPADRSLKGFTRPVNRIVDELKDAGILPREAASLLSSRYDEDIVGYQRTNGFRVPAEVVRLVHEAKRGREATAQAVTV